MSQAIPAGIQQSFDSTVSPVFAASGALVIVHVGQPNQLINGSSAFHDSNAHEIIQSATLRAGLGRELAANWSSANTSSTIWNDAALSLKALSLSYLESKGVSQATFRLEFSDGSVVYYKITSDDTAQADYTPGKSSDPDGNKIADSSAGGGSGGGFTGTYNFSSPGSLQDWIDTAVMNGVQFTNGTPTERLSCSWNGQTLTCRYI